MWVPHSPADIQTFQSMYGSECPVCVLLQLWWFSPTYFQIMNCLGPDNVFTYPHMKKNQWCEIWTSWKQDSRSTFSKPSFKKPSIQSTANLRLKWGGTLFCYKTISLAFPHLTSYTCGKAILKYQGNISSNGVFCKMKGPMTVMHVISDIYAKHSGSQFWVHQVANCSGDRFLWALCTWFDDVYHTLSWSVWSGLVVISVPNWGNPWQIVWSTRDSHQYIHQNCTNSNNGLQFSKPYDTLWLLADGCQFTDCSEYILPLSLKHIEHAQTKTWRVF
jgi:hypothetical protein